MDGIKEIIDSLVSLANGFSNAPPYDLLPIIMESLNDSNYPRRSEFQMTRIHPDVCMVSGGLDSTIAWLVSNALGKSPQPVYIDFGQCYKDIELARLLDLGISTSLQVYEYKINALWDYYIPLRNLIIVMTGLRTGGYGTNIWMGYVSSEGPGDKSALWVEMVRDYLDQFDSKLYLTNVYTKSEWVSWACRHGHTDKIMKTYSCLNGQVPMYGECKSCFKHAYALVNGGIRKSIVLELFKTNPFVSKYAKYYYEQVLLTSKDDYRFPFLHELAKNLGEQL
jgi:7-cyano-7-deazaguanine synthase in queuosine biosynthesis